ncbi:MAG TPA: hypothetical protein VM733_07840 [Thermoanaerobaculia bacterium]|nr:hypothetical protein [Thermoanaerobaculia bacterium]
MKKLLALLLLVACSKTAAPGAGSALTRAMKPYEGEWRKINGTDHLKIRADGGGYVIEFEGKKYAGAVENGLLRVYHPMSTLAALVTSEDHLLIAGEEYRRTDERAEAAKETMASMRSLATALEARATDFNAYGDSNDMVDVPIDRVASVLQPTYSRNVPTTDAWGTMFSVRWSSGGYEIRSTGANRAAEDAPAHGTTSSFDCDIIFANGSFTAWPEGTD